MQERKLTIFFTSDLHSYIYPTDYRSQAKKELGLFKCASQFQVGQRHAIFQPDDPRRRPVLVGMAPGVFRDGARRTGLARSGRRTSGRADDAGYAAAHGSKRNPACRSVQYRAAGGKRRADLRHEPCQRRSRTAADRAAQGYFERISVHEYADGAADHRRGSAPGDGAQRGVFYPARGRDARHLRCIFEAEGRALQLRLLCRGTLCL